MESLAPGGRELGEDDEREPEPPAQEWRLCLEAVLGGCAGRLMGEHMASGFLTSATGWCDTSQGDWDIPHTGRALVTLASRPGRQEGSPASLGTAASSQLFPGSLLASGSSDEDHGWAGQAGTASPELCSGLTCPGVPAAPARG